MNFREPVADLKCLKQELIKIRSDLIENAVKIAKVKYKLGALKLKEEQGDVRGCSKNTQ